MWVAGHRFVTDADTLRDIKCKLIIDCTPFYPQDVGDKPQEIVGLSDEEQPDFASWSIMLNNRRCKVLINIMNQVRACWAAGGSIVFHDNQRG